MIIIVKSVIDARDQGIRPLMSEYRTFKGGFLDAIRGAVRPIIKDKAFEVNAKQKWQIGQDFAQYVKNYPFHPMPFHNQSVTLHRNKQGQFQMEFRIRRENREGRQNPICNLIVPFKYHEFLAEAVGKDNPILGEVRINEDKHFGRFNVHITLRLPTPQPYDSHDGWIGVDIGWNKLATSVHSQPSGEAKDITFHGKDYKTKILRLKYLLKVAQRHNRTWKSHLQNVTANTVGNIAKEVVQKALKHHAGIRLEKLTFPSHTNHTLIPRYKLQQAIRTLAERKGVPIQFVNAYYTSLRCNRCGTLGYRESEVFHCLNCSYEVNADVNAAINIGRGNPLGYMPNGKAPDAICVVGAGQLASPLSLPMNPSKGERQTQHQPTRESTALQVYHQIY